jgi:hypothetical protein
VGCFEEKDCRGGVVERSRKSRWTNGVSFAEAEIDRDDISGVERDPKDALECEKVELEALRLQLSHIMARKAANSLAWETTNQTIMMMIGWSKLSNADVSQKTYWLHPNFQVDV